MPKLVLKFKETVLKEVVAGAREVSIGRSPDNVLVIDNPAISNYHARVFAEEGRLMLEDFGSLNGTFINGQRVKMVELKEGDSIAIGKHTIMVWQSEEGAEVVTGGDSSRPAPPKIAETVVLDTKERREFPRRWLPWERARKSRRRVSKCRRSWCTKAKRISANIC
jgi:pSer/pThr/pTyr-binding forkhead associated (FHA) protein